MSSFPQLRPITESSVLAEIKTTKGTIQLELFPEAAPKAVENFVGLAKNGYYDGVIFHRVIADFMIQAGDPTGTGYNGQSLWGKPFKDEFSKEHFNIRGALSMANSGPNTNGSQFFIVTAGPETINEQLFSAMERAGFPEEIIQAYREKGGEPGLDGRYTVFGQVREGMDVAEAISRVQTNPMDKPLEEVKIQSIEITNER